MELTLDFDDPLFQLKKDENDGFDKSLFKLKKDLSKEGCKHLIAFARFATIKLDDTGKIRTSKQAHQKDNNKEQWDGHVPAFSLDNEIEAWRYINKAADIALSKYPTLLEEDIEILEKDRR